MKRLCQKRRKRPTKKWENRYFTARKLYVLIRGAHSTWASIGAVWANGNPGGLHTKDQTMATCADVASKIASIPKKHRFVRQSHIVRAEGL